ncbi:hypothetical protein G6F46_010797 [Rhizopus delemar]|uniref:Velvet domain-containing protein n=2 Tax=Rhizopus TaxID=4842 RepID=A0A9P6YUR5_9FUNG|nr:hypothetical protein G6F43_006605 [Rhizopus delemar]KAG1542873.1 hypothetical protein G6F51_007013 [Rhizopus arrhizus]KAG1458179.1 hypothetical protein G6F55_005490 [Rhizopus delemar]KAG1498786.1 hypothetical protein G6F54_004841 [Rhizopus delemar]KAG1502001.1 hypothetical protein G6F53_010956 [Rhizopus delemar]
MDNTTSTEDLFNLINFSGEQEEFHAPSSSSPPDKHITFMKPNIDVLLDYPVNKLYEKYLKQQELPSSKNIYLLEIVEQPQQCRISSDSEKDRRPIDPAPIVKLTVLDRNIEVAKKYLKKL